MSLEFASNILKNDKEVVLTAVSNYGYALMHASSLLKSDREVIIAAVKNDGLALQFANNFNSDLFIVLAALSQNGTALEFVDPGLRDNDEVVQFAIKENVQAYTYSSKRIKNTWRPL